MNATLAQLHSYDPAGIGLSDYGRGENYVARQVDRWSKQYRAARDREDRRDGAPDGVAPRASAARRSGAPRARRLPARQHDPACDRAEGARGARLGALYARRSARRLHLSLHAVAHAAFGLRRRHRLAGRARPESARHSVDERVRRRLRGANRPRSAALPRRSIRPTISSASPRSCRASSGACATAPRPTRMHPPARRWCGRSPRRPGSSRAKRARNELR